MKNQNKLLLYINLKQVMTQNVLKSKYTKCKNAKIWGEQQLSLPFHAKMNNHEVITVCKTLRDFFKKKLFNDLQKPKAN